jgi:poly-gamma-glutamate biosynthesis protein PgsC/CapC
MELLPLAVGIGLVIGLLSTELFGMAAAGLIVPGYIALYMNRPYNLLATVAVAFATFAIVRFFSAFLVVFGRRRTALMILLGYILGMLVNNWSGLMEQDFAAIGFVIPGLIAVWMDRQTVLTTLTSLFTISVVVRLILILAVGTEGLP